MGENKKWKRLAKRVKGHCIEYVYLFNCSVCPHDLIECDCIIANTGDTPVDVGIRTIERICKNGK